MNRSFHLVSFSSLHTNHTFPVNEGGLMSESLYQHTSNPNHFSVSVCLSLPPSLPPSLSLSPPHPPLSLSKAPTDNISSIASGATVLEGVSRSRNALLNGNTRDYDWDSGYTCHQLGSGSIVVQLAQPYIVSSMRCVCHGIVYSVYIMYMRENLYWVWLQQISNFQGN